MPSAHGLGDVALVAMHGVHHELQSRIDDAARLLGIEVFQQCHGTLDVSKQYGDLFALAFQGGARGENLLGEILGSIGEWHTLRVNLRGLGRHWPAGPHEHSTVFIDSESLALNEFGLHVL